MAVDPTYLALLACLAALVLSERVLAPARRQLSAEEKLRLVDAISEIRYAAYIPSVLAVVILGSATAMWPQHTGPIVIAVYAVYLGAVLAVSTYVWRQLRALEIRESYVRRWVQSQAIYTLGIAGLCASVASYYLYTPQ